MSRAAQPFILPLILQEFKVKYPRQYTISWITRAIRSNFTKFYVIPSYSHETVSRKRGMAQLAEKIVGAVWTRILSGTIKGFGNVDEQTPEFAIALCEEYRNRGIGTALIMRSMLQLLRGAGI